MQARRRLLILKVILKSMLLFAVLWLLWVMLSSIPGGPRPRLQSGADTLFTGSPLVAILPPGYTGQVSTRLSTQINVRLRRNNQ